jgi:hypothetical protein
MRASLLARATTAAFLCIRFISPCNQPPSGVALAASTGSTDRAPWMSSSRKYLLPRCDANQPGFAAGGDLAWHQPEPGREIASTREGFAAADAMFFLLRGGCPWRMLPAHFLPHQTVYRWFTRLRDDGSWERLNHHLVMLDRERLGRRAPRLPS